MTRAPELKSIDCTACGAGLDILGGGRVTTHVCPYCGTELDALDGYKALRRFGDMPRPDTPFGVGQTGTIKGVPWTIIGTLGLTETYRGRRWDWAEHQLYSPTHGYAWLTVEDGHLAFSRRQRRAPRPDWMGVQWVETSETRPTVLLDGARYVYYQTTEATLAFAEGEFTWAPNVGDVTVTVSALADDAMLDFSETAEEREIYRSEWLEPAATLTAFGRNADALKPVGKNPLQPYRSGPNQEFLKLAAPLMAVIAAVLGLALAVLPGKTVLPETTLRLSDLPQEVSFAITQPSRLAGIYLRSDAANSWAYVDLDLTGPEDETLFEAGRTMEYYIGSDSDGSWSEGSNSASLYFLPTEAGTYTLTLDGPETGVWTSPGYPSRQPALVAVSAKQGLSSGFYLLLLAAGFLGVTALVWGRRMLHDKARWAQSDWDDD